MLKSKSGRDAKSCSGDRPSLAPRPLVRRVVLRVAPVGKPRMTRQDQWRVDSNPDPKKRKRPAVRRYHQYQDALVEEAARQRFEVPDAGLALAFFVPMPKSWSKKKRARMQGQPHRAKPDVDNLVKAFFDALLEEDSTIWSLVGLEKRWSEQGYIVASLYEP